MKKISCIIPVLNEENISEVLDVVDSSGLIDEIILVNDGSDQRFDDIYKAALFDKKNSYYLHLKNNIGKTKAVLRGAKKAKHPLLLLLDGDLKNLTKNHLKKLVEPVQKDLTDMTIGVLKKNQNNSEWTQFAQQTMPFLSGQRCMKKEVLQKLDELKIDDQGYGLEILLTMMEKTKMIKKPLTINLTGVSQYVKEKKMGISEGTKRRIKMYGQIGLAALLFIKIFSRLKSKPPKDAKQESS